MGLDKTKKKWIGPSNSDQYMSSRSTVPQVSAIMSKNVSEIRRQGIANEVEQGFFRDGSSPKENGATYNSHVVSSVGITKNAQVVSSGGFGGGGGDTVKQTPEVYSPLWLNSNLNLPRDRATINAWCRSFYALNPFVHNAVNLHSTYPISKLNIKCPNKDIEKFFNDMIEEIDLMNICVQIAQEYWLLGESFVYADLDESRGKWNRLVIQNPDYMIVKRTVVASEPIIMLRPDENLKKIIFSNRPTDIEQRKQLNNHIIDSVKRGENIPLDNFHISHLARRISPYEIRGTGLPVCIFRQLMLFDKLRECYSDDTEVLTNKGFKKINDLVHKTSNIGLNANYVNGIELDENKQISSILTMKEDFTVACFNSKTNCVEYHKPVEMHMSSYSGKMIHFTGKKVDCLVSPNHNMWVDQKVNNKWTGYKKKKAIDILNGEIGNYKFLSEVNFNNTLKMRSVKVCDKNIPIKLYLKVLGYLVSEGCIYENFTKKNETRKNRYDAFITVCQYTDSDCYEDMRDSFNKLANILGKNCRNFTKQVDTGYGNDITGIIKDIWRGDISGKKLTEHFKNEIGTNINGKINTKSHFKKLPRWVFDLHPQLMSILLNSLVKGDGTETISKYGTGSKGFKYSTVSKQLANDVYELAYKIGYVPNICISNVKKSDGIDLVEYIVMWSDTCYGNKPNITNAKKVGNNGGGARINEVDYDGVVWCFEVPTGLFITRRNGKITIQGNSKFAQADGMVNPLTLIKIGTDSADGLHPSFADLEAWREVFECHDEETQVLTEDGFKTFEDVMEYSEVMDGTYNYPVCLAYPKKGVKIACFNPNNEQLEYHEPTNASLYNYEGDMYHFSNKKIDIKVTPNHNMYASKRSTGSKYGKWEKIKADKLKINDYYKFRSCVNWVGKEVESVDVCGKQVPINNYLEFLGYLLSEGSVFKTNQNSYHINICQSTITEKKYYPQMKKCFEDFASYLDVPAYDSINKNGMWGGFISRKNIYTYFKNEIGQDNNTKSAYKRVPKWIMELSPRLLNIILDALVMGDGSISKSRKTSMKFCRYTTISKQLADDVYEIAYKCGYVPLLAKSFRKNKNVYDISWSIDNGKGSYPVVHRGFGEHSSEILKVEKYNGKVWCFEVPTGLFITRRNGKITIQGNSAQYDKDFKIFTHAGVTVERVGYGQGIYDISGDITQIIKEIYVGLQVPPVLMDGGADTSYANGGVALDVLRQRYMQFRNMMSQWLKRKIFAPISKIQGFYDYSGGEKQLIVPDIDWNHMSLFDAGDYISSLIILTQGEGDAKRASLHTLYRSMGLEFEDETRKIRKEAIQSAINVKEKAALAAMDLNALRALDEEDEIPEIDAEGAPSAGGEAPLPGEAAGAAPGGSMPGLDLGPPPTPPPPPEATPPPPPA